MKNLLIKSTIGLFFLLTVIVTKANLNEPNGVPVYTISYSKNCFIGCGTVEIERTPVSWPHDDGTRQRGIFRTVNCRGIGFNACPSRHSDIINEEEETNWIDNSSGEMFDHAIDQMENEVNSGTYRKTYQNIETGQTFVFEVKWSYTEVSEGEWEQTVTVAIIQ